MSDLCVGVMVQVFGKGGAVIARLIWDGDFLCFTVSLMS